MEDIRCKYSPFTGDPGHLQNTNTTEEDQVQQTEPLLGKLFTEPAEQVVNENMHI